MPVEACMTMSIRKLWSGRRPITHVSDGSRRKWGSIADGASGQAVVHHRATDQASSICEVPGTRPCDHEHQPSPDQSSCAEAFCRTTHTRLGRGWATAIEDSCDYRGLNGWKG